LRKKTKERKRVSRNFKKPTIAMVIAVSISLYILSISANLVFAGDGSIAMSNTYPEDGGTYGVVDHFSYQITAANSNTTVSIRIDDGPLIPMQYRGITNEVGTGDNVALDWYTWQVTIPAITAQGKHSFQFFSHYCVWQGADQCWAEFDSYSNVQSFTIAFSSSTPSMSLPPTTTNPTEVIVILATLPLAAIVLLIFFLLQKRGL
jgi:hypothetical protein